MDTTQMEELLTQLETADASDAPDIADELTAALATALDDRPSDRAAESGRAAEPEPGSGP